MGLFQNSKTKEVYKLRAAGFTLAHAERLAQERQSSGTIVMTAGLGVLLLAGAAATVGWMADGSILTGQQQKEELDQNPRVAVLSTAVDRSLIRMSVLEELRRSAPPPTVAAQETPEPRTITEPPSADIEPVPAAQSPEVAIVQTAFEDTPAPQTVALPDTEVLAAASPLQCVQDLDAYLTGLFIQFDVASAEVPAAGKQLLANIHTQMSDCPDAQLQIAGHSDSSGDDALNLQLSWLRADNTVDVLSALGTDMASLEAVGFGARAPLQQGSSTDDPVNRRVDFRVTAKREALQ